jgi:hypothetical protein
MICWSYPRTLLAYLQGIEALTFLFDFSYFEVLGMSVPSTYFLYVVA